jgi:hypothetical protein
MSAPEEPTSEFEKRTRAVLEESVSRVDGRIRSRLNQARHAALDAVPNGRRSFFGERQRLPVTGAIAAALLVAVVMWTRTPDPTLPVVADSAQTTFEDLDLLADADALDLIEEEDDDAFLEWAASQASEEVTG